MQSSKVVLGLLCMVLWASAGNCITVFALNFNVDPHQAAQLQPLVELFEVCSSQVLSCCLLCVPSQRDPRLYTQHHSLTCAQPCVLMVQTMILSGRQKCCSCLSSAYCPSPLAARLLKPKSVQTTFLVFGQHTQELLEVYSLLHEIRLLGTIQCAGFDVSTRLMQIFAAPQVARGEHYMI